MKAAASGVTRLQGWATSLARDAYRPEAFRKGIIVGLLSAVPFIVCIYLQEPLLAIFSSLAAVRLGMADPGGAYANRFRTMLAGLACVTTGTLLGTALADGPLYYLPLVAVLVFAFAYLAALGPEGVAVSILTLFLTVVSLGVPGDPFIRAGAVFLAGTYMMAGLLLRWPIHPDGPARRAMAGALEAVATLADRIAESSTTEDSERGLWHWRTLAYRSLDNALLVLTEGLSRGSRDGRRGPPLRQLAFAASAARDMTRSLTLLAERRAGLPDWLLAELQVEAAALRQVSQRLPRLSLSLASASGLDLEMPPLEQRAGREDPRLPAELQIPYGDFRAAAGALRAALGPGGERQPPGLDSELLPKPGRILRLPAWAWPRFRANFTFQSTAFRHALRMALMIAVATALVWHFGIAFGYWVMLTIVMVAKPAYGGTRNAVGARMLGTIIGAALAEAVLLGTQDFWVLAALALLLNCLSHAVITSHYALGVTLLTPYVIFKIAAALPDTDVAMPRLIATLIGGALIAASLLLWAPARYRGFWTAVSDTLSALQQVVTRMAEAAAAGTAPPPIRAPELTRAHRSGRMALQNAEAVVNEIFLEPAAWHPNRRELRGVITDLQRLSWTMVSMSDPHRDLAVAAMPLAQSAALMAEIAAACKALDRPREQKDAGDWPKDLPQRVRQVTEPLDSAPDEVLRRFGAGLRDLAEDLTTLHRLRVATAADAAAGRA